MEALTSTMRVLSAVPAGGGTHSSREGTTSSMTQNSKVVIGGVDTHKDVHVAAAIDENGAMLGVRSFSTTRAGYHELWAWLCSFGRLAKVGVEGTGSYGVRPARFLEAAGAQVVEINRPDRRMRRRRGKAALRRGRVDPRPSSCTDIGVEQSHPSSEPDPRPDRYRPGRTQGPARPPSMDPRVALCSRPAAWRRPRKPRAGGESGATCARPPLPVPERRNC